MNKKNTYLPTFEVRNASVSKKLQLFFLHASERDQIMEIDQIIFSQVKHRFLLFSANFYSTLEYLKSGKNFIGVFLLPSSINILFWKNSLFDMCYGFFLLFLTVQAMLLLQISPSFNNQTNLYI